MFLKRATQDDVARLAGVTRATVSYVLNGKAEGLKITKPVIERVKTAATKLRYVPNLAARSLAAGKSKQIGLMVPGLHYLQNVYWAPMIAGVERAALKAGYDVLLLASHGDAFSTAENYLLQKRVDVIVKLGDSDSRELLARLPCPPVLIGEPSLTGNTPSVHSNIGEALGKAVDALAARGARRIHWVGPASGVHRPSEDRIDFIRKRAKHHGMEVSSIDLPGAPLSENTTPAVEIANCHQAIKKSADLLSGAEAIICWNDLVALAIYDWMAERSLKPGKDIAVIGIDDRYAETALPPLSSINFNNELLGEAAVKLALQVLDTPIESRCPPYPQLPVEANFIERQSSQLPV